MQQAPRPGWHFHIQSITFLSKSNTTYLTLMLEPLTSRGIPAVSRYIMMSGPKSFFPTLTLPEQLAAL